MKTKTIFVIILAMLLALYIIFSIIFWDKSWVNNIALIYIVCLGITLLIQTLIKKK